VSIDPRYRKEVVMYGTVTEPEIVPDRVEGKGYQP
jgi:hypothetical protein